MTTKGGENRNVIRQAVGSECREPRAEKNFYPLIERCSLGGDASGNFRHYEIFEKHFSVFQSGSR